MAFRRRRLVDVASVIGGELRRMLARRFSREEAEGLALTAGFLACALIVVTFGLLAREVFEPSGAEPLDRQVTLWARGLPLPGGAETARALSFFGGFSFLCPGAIVVVAVLAWRRHRISAMLFAGALLGGWGLETLLKLAFHRGRPDLAPLFAHETTFAFPSGHATMSTVFFGGLAAIVFHLTGRPWPRAGVVAGATLGFGSVSFSRVYLGVHWVTDVAAGVLVGLFWVIVAATATEMIAVRRRR